MLGYGCGVSQYPQFHVKDLDMYIEEHHRCFRLGSYFMDALWEVVSYYRGGFSLCRTGSVCHVMVPGGSTFHLEPGTWNNTPLL